MTRNPPDPLAHHLARKHIGRPQYLAGMEFRKHHAAKDDRLAKCYRELGVDGTAVVNAMLIEGMSAKEVAEARGQTGPDWQRYYARRYFLCLNTLAAVYGFANGASRVAV